MQNFSNNRKNKLMVLKYNQSQQHASFFSGKLPSSNDTRQFKIIIFYSRSKGNLVLISLLQGIAPLKEVAAIYVG